MTSTKPQGWQNPELPTISQLAYLDETHGGYYFSRATLRFFGQTRRDFRVKRLSDGRIAVYSRHGKHGVKSCAVHNPQTGTLDHADEAARGETGTA